MAHTFPKLSLVALLLTTAVAACSGDDAGDTSDDVSEGAEWLGTWNDQDRAAWYLTPQGSHLVDYRVFLAIETASSELPFSSQRNLERLGFAYPRSQAARTEYTRDGLPLGLLKDTKELASTYADEPPGDYLGFSCAACHTGEVRTTDREGKAHRWLVEGGQSNLDLDSFMEELRGALEASSADPKKHARVCARIGKDCDARLARSLSRVRGLTTRSPVAVRGGFGRMDAMARIMNEVLGHHYHSPNDAAPVSAPVSIPQVWDAPSLSCVQTNCINRNRLGRNVGQVFGVFGETQVGPKIQYGDARLEGVTLVGTPKVENLAKLEHALESNHGPKWRHELGELDGARVRRGEQIYANKCASCHTRPFLFPKPEELVRTNPEAVKANYELEQAPGTKGVYLQKAVAVPYADVQTDPAFLDDALARFSSSEEAKTVLEDVMRRGIAKKLGTGSSIVIEPALLALKAGQVRDGYRKLDGSVSQLVLVGVSTNAYLDTYFEPRSDDPAQRAKNAARRADLEGNRFGDPALDLRSYRARPLNGIAFTAPYFHNGSCPTLVCVLDPAERAKNRTFVVRPGSFDPTKVGLDTSPPRPGEKSFTFDTSLHNNSNRGHEGPGFGTDLSADDRSSLIEYLKSI